MCRLKTTASHAWLKPWPHNTQQATTTPAPGRRACAAYLQCAGLLKLPQRGVLGHGHLEVGEVQAWGEGWGEGRRVAVRETRCNCEVQFSGGEQLQASQAGLPPPQLPRQQVALQRLAHNPAAHLEG